jgi:hypothetical protein
VLVEPVTLPPLYAPLIHVDLTGVDEAAAAARLRGRLIGGRPTCPPPFGRPDLTTFCRHGELGLEGIRARLEPDRAVLARANSATLDLRRPPPCRGQPRGQLP